jgi:pimeloyl-ACP methyl ester carboxylesterase
VESLYHHARLLDLDRARVCVATLDPLVAGAGRRVLLLHGNPSQLDHFRPLVPALRRRAGVIAFDHPGLGRSGDFTSGEVTLERSARLGLAVLDALGVTDAVDVVGHSHGGMVAVAMAAMAPERVRSLVLLGTGGTPTHGSYRLLSGIPGLASLLPALATRLYRRPGLAGLARGVTAITARGSFAPDPTPAGFVEEEAEAIRARPELLGTMVRLALDAPCDKVALLARGVRAPTLMIHATHDSLVGISHARGLFAILREGAHPARFVEIAGGHMAHFTRPERVSPLLDAWLEG